MLDGGHFPNRKATAMNRKNLAALAVLGTLVGTALGNLPHPPGYTWGIANCGPAHTDSRGACLLCCAAGQRNGEINSIERDGCDQLCEDANFSRDTFWSFFWRGYRPFNF